MAGQLVITLSLNQWEKTLLADFQHSFQNHLASRARPPEVNENDVFNRWGWACKVSNDLEGALENTPQILRYPAPITWKRICQWLSHSDDGVLCPSRLAQLLDDNDSLSTHFTTSISFCHPDTDVKIIPNGADAPLWTVVNEVIHCLPVPWRGLRDNESVSDSIGNYILVDDLSLEKATLLLDGGSFDPETVSMGLRSVLEQLRRDRIDGSANCDDSSVTRFSPAPRLNNERLASGTQSSSDIMMLLRGAQGKLRLDIDPPETSPLRAVLPTPDASLAGNAESLATASNTNGREPFDHPYEASAISQYAMYNIWSLVRMASMTCRRKLRDYAVGSPTAPAFLFQFPTFLDDPGRWLEYIPLQELGGSSGISTGHELQWRPQHQILLDHHLFTEEEVFRHCVDARFEFPGYKNEGSIVFIPSALHTSLVLHDLTRLEDLWNDCAVTVDPLSGQWYLLETIPGILFRQIAYGVGTYAARAYFRNLVDHFRLQRPLQLDYVFSDTFEASDLVRLKQYSGLVDVIDLSEITSYEDLPLGGQSRGVFRAEWCCPHKINMSSQRTFTVALKRVWPPHSALRPEAKLLRELNFTLGLSTRRPTGRSILYGVTEAPGDHPLARLTPNESHVQERNIFLVFEFARKRLFQYLSDTITGTDGDWDLITHLFEDLLYSIGTIHNEGIVHRDIHCDNIMIREETFTRSPTVVSGDQLVIIDLGESRTLDTMEESINIYGYQEFWAPEVKSGRTMSMASDMYAIGMVMRRVLQKRCEIAHTHYVPKPLLNAANSCLQKNTSARPTAQQISQEMGEINWQHFVLLDSGLGEVVFREDEFTLMLPSVGNSQEDTYIDECVSVNSD